MYCLLLNYEHKIYSTIFCTLFACFLSHQSTAVAAVVEVGVAVNTEGAWDPQWGAATVPQTRGSTPHPLIPLDPPHLTRDHSHLDTIKVRHLDMLNALVMILPINTNAILYSV